MHKHIIKEMLKNESIRNKIPNKYIIRQKHHTTYLYMLRTINRNNKILTSNKHHKYAYTACFFLFMDNTLEIHVNYTLTLQLT